MVTTPDNDLKGPAVRFPPPLIFLGVTVASLALQRVAPLSLGSAPALSYAGVALVVVGLVVIGVAGVSFHRAKTHIEPWKPTTHVISQGIFAYSRNPIYVAFAVMQIGIGLWLSNAWTVLTVTVSVILVYYIAIRNEEKYLEGKFGDQYLKYKRDVRRWL